MIAYRLLGSMLLVAATAAGCSLASGSSPTGSAPIEPPATASPFGASGCDGTVADAVARTLTAQFDAFNAGDFEAAYALSSREFQASADLPTFVQLLESGYPEVVQSRSHRIDDCAQPEPGIVFAVVQVTGRNERTVRIPYRLVLQDDGWRVDGAGGSEPVVAGAA